MILFVVDQIAGAEYIAPLLRKWLLQGRHDWMVLATSKSSACLNSSGIPHELLSSCTDKDVEDWLDRLSPDRALLSTSMPNDLEHLFVRALQSRAIPCAQLIDNWINLRGRFEFKELSGSIALLVPDCVLALDEHAKNILVGGGLPENRIEVIGQPHWEDCWRRALDSPITPVEPKLGLMVSQPISRFYGRQLGYDEKDFVRCCLESWDSVGLDSSRLHLLVHPAEDPNAYADLLDKAGKRVAILRGADVRLARYSLILGMSSSMLIQSLLEGVATVSVQPGAIGEDRCVASERVFIPRFLTSEDLARYLCAVWPSSASTSNSIEHIEKVVDGSLTRLEECLLNFPMRGNESAAIAQIGHHL